MGYYIYATGSISVKLYSKFHMTRLTRASYLGISTTCVGHDTRVGEGGEHDVLHHRGCFGGLEGSRCS